MWTKTYTRLTNGIRDAIAPDVTMFVRHNPKTASSASRLRGQRKPYYLKSKGISPAVYMFRQGASSVQASPDQIRRMTGDCGDVFEEMRRPGTVLEEAARASACYKVYFCEENTSRSACAISTTASTPIWR